MLPPPDTYDAVVVGGGPSGIFAAHGAALAGARVLLLEAGAPMADSLCPRVKLDTSGRLVRASERFRMQCPRCTCLTGLGGAAFHFDTNLGYSHALTRSKIEVDETGEIRPYSTLERALPPFTRAQDAVREVFDLLRQHGLPASDDSGPAADPPGAVSELFEGVDLSTSQEITVDRALTVVDSVMTAFVEAGGEVAFRSRVTSIRAGDVFRVTAATPAGEREVTARSVVVAGGKLGMSWIRTVVAGLGVAHEPTRKVDIGVRVEGAREQFGPLSAWCDNPKLSFVNDRGESVRTFCVCAGGRIMQYDFEDTVVLDGQHCMTKPTRRSNFGVVTTVAVPPGTDGTEHALDLARAVSKRGGGKPVACTVAELRRERVEDVALDTSLIDFTHAPLSECLPTGLVSDVLAMVDRLNTAFPDLVADSAVVAAPVVERIYPRLVLSEHMESSVPGLYFVGDASSKVIGVTYGAATGLAAARHLAGSRRS
ncbi:NAD(P)/FAD-dependent oxidoreductase [Kutzneria kofuensis]|uniref:FAD-dependent oxidoreductase n=1 Tax=Kutzneria kofuensis TaxID=103725 RepID=A0A7W9NK80_9PSEU|nr:NAD(P)/FAD-dependent oxidoreductase [Kutzneria kofuensis]MBB5896347.1 hypothetical protein [Kutzneria kofuensis]